MEERYDALYKLADDILDAYSERVDLIDPEGETEEPAEADALRARLEAMKMDTEQLMRAEALAALVILDGMIENADQMIRDDGVEPENDPDGQYPALAAYQLTRDDLAVQYDLDEEMERDDREVIRARLEFLADGIGDHVDDARQLQLTLELLDREIEAISCNLRDESGDMSAGGCEQRQGWLDDIAAMERVRDYLEGRVL